MFGLRQSFFREEIGLLQASIHGMNWFGPRARIEIFDKEDRLLIRAIDQQRWIDLVKSGCVVLGFVFILWFDRSWLWILCFLAIAPFGLISWFHIRTGELWITEKEIEGYGDLCDPSSRHVHLGWSDISGLQYGTGGEHDATGLYVRRNWWGSTCILANLNEEQVSEIIAAIYRRFPYLEMAEDQGEVSSLFGGGSGLTTLGLSKPDNKDQ